MHGRRDMTQIYFHCSSPRGSLMDQPGIGVDVGDLTEGRECAAQVVRSLIGTPSLEDWRQWLLHARDELGEEIFVVPFDSVLGRPH
jgi:uncharacterized protein DUF6894